ncbi:MAG: helix-turn-helix domain-containing protein [Anaerolineales bacterium]|nr:helix-turn-helix domain-containing protein [Anaerolineales bacterium]
MEALWLKRHDLPHAQIAELVGVTENAIRDYFELYQQGGVEKLKELSYYVPESKLNAHVTSLEAHFREPPPASIKEAQSEIEVITGVKRSETQVTEFLKKTQFALSKSRDDPSESGSAKAERISGTRDSA